MKYQRLTIGVGVGRDSVRAVALHGGRIVWTVERAGGTEAVGQTIESALAEAPIPRWPRPRAVVAVGPAYVQTKRLTGLPAIADSSRLGDVVRESPGRFFLKNGVPLATTCRPSSDGPPWGAAIERPLLDGIANACRVRRVRLAEVVPTVVVLGVDDGETSTKRVMWTDGDVRLELSFDGGELLKAVRVTTPADPRGADVSSADLNVLGPDGHRFADALAAARLRRGTVLSWGGPTDAAAARVPRWRLAAAAMAVLVAGTAWLTAAGVSAQLAERDASQYLTRLADARRDVTYAERELARVTGALNEVNAFDAPRYAITALLADITKALPDESAIVTLNLKRDTGNLVALTPRAATVLASLDPIPGVEGVEIIGPVTREVLAGRTLERVTVRFHLNAAARRSSDTPTGRRS